MFIFACFHQSAPSKRLLIFQIRGFVVFDFQTVNGGYVTKLQHNTVTLKITYILMKALN